MGRLREEDLLRMAVRASVLQATWNYERQQGLGWAWALEPALHRLYPDAGLRRERLADHTAYFNTQPTMASLALGAVANLEERRAAGMGPDGDTITHIKNVLGASLAALGDRLFWFTLRPFVAVLGVFFALSNAWVGAVVLWVCYNALHQGIRLQGVRWGYALGPEVLGDSQRQRWMKMIDGLAWAGTILVALLVAELLVPRGEPRPLGFQALLATGLGLGVLTAQRPRPSPTEWGLLVGAVSWALTWFH